MKDWETKIYKRPEIYYNKNCFPDAVDYFGRPYIEKFLLVSKNEFQKVRLEDNKKWWYDYRNRDKRISHFLNKLRIKNNWRY